MKVRFNKLGRTKITVLQAIHYNILGILCSFCFVILLHKAVLLYRSYSVPSKESEEKLKDMPAIKEDHSLQGKKDSKEYELYLEESIDANVQYEEATQKQAIIFDRLETYQLPNIYWPEQLYLKGQWHSAAECKLSESFGEVVFYCCQSNALTFCAAAYEDPVEVTVFLDGAPISKELRGDDVIEKLGATYLEIVSEKNYSILKNSTSYGSYMLEFHVPPGLLLYHIDFEA